MTQELDTTFDPASIEKRWYAHWEESGAFRPSRPDAEPFTIVNPPPNVTGSLHIGHALDNTLQDIVIRYERLRGKDALWVVGTDHAGIATQMVVERQMELRQDKRTNYSREEFVDKVWEWKAESGGTITTQLRRLGCSMDWSREQFTMDEHFTKAVLKVFVDLYNDGLLYRDKRLVNWDPKLKTAISDLEVESRDVNGHMWHFKYPLAGGETYTYVERDVDGNVTLEEERDYISIATTRPETMLGDGAVAVHPDDARYAPIVGKLCEIPVGPKEHRRLIPIITDEYPDPDFGSGAVKITGAHDENDFGVAQRNGIPMYRLMDEAAAMRRDGAPYAEVAKRAMEIARGAEADAEEIDALNLVPDEYRGLDRYEARKKVVADIDAEGLMIMVEDKFITQPFGDRGGVVIEPMLMDQWYVNAGELSKKPIEAVKSGEIEIVPKSWEKTFFNWMENIQPWCVSRQLWWGHRIPAWYDADGNVYVAETEEDAQAQAGDGVALKRDEDVLDTWFSSALWPFATLGWPEDNAALYEKHYPNDLLISGFDILFFWDARMMMAGYYNTGQAPWPRLYLHGLVRAADGAKMSKSKGNVVDPLGLIDQYGADALRFFMAAMESQGRDIKMDEKRVEGYRNFATKLWNATRFCQSNGIGASSTLAAPEAKLAANQWIIGEVQQTLEELDKAMAELRFDAAANTIYQFTWSRFCDWYLELIKPVFAEGASETAAAETRAVAGWALDQILVMLHPFMPFITEELWHALGTRKYDLILAKWPNPRANVSKPATDAIDWVIELTSNVRSAKNELGISPGAKLAAFLPKASDLATSTIERSSAAVERLARLTPVTISEAPSGPAMQITAGEDVFIIPLEGIIDINAEKARLEKALAASQKEAKSLEGRLSNANFVERAKPEAVEKAKADFAHHSAEAERLQAALERLG
ncbi:valine--tRNA ligase [Altererythrobacter lutimaris]|uniref:Valine--tRNA ligase n=1 Tax=Altererythrobacter lutimaris TaxID=2743979 RepID=A0A850H6B6_9SPHN|nr:valine--tRNA ligase [Altererythrobacter lutimaris]NVE94784.1 valine--tRNA ligase [Altererythrobacter lutimaris]